MATHRYWRATEVVPYDQGLRFVLSEFWLLAGTTRVDAGAVLTSSASPVSGTLSALADNDVATDATFARGTTLQWDFGATPQDVTDVRLGAGVSVLAFPESIKLQWSDTGTEWVDAVVVQGIVWPGSRRLTQSVAGTPVVVAVTAPIAVAAGTSVVLSPPSTTRPSARNALVVALMHRAPVTTPAGWTLLSSAGPFSNANLSQWTSVYLKLLVSDADLASATFTQSASGRMVGAVMEMAGLNGPVVFDSQATGGFSSLDQSTVAIPAVTAGDDRTALVVASSILAAIAPATDPWVPSAGWTIRVGQISASDNRLGVATRELAAGATASGSMTLGTNVGNGMTANTVLLRSVAGIERQPFVARAGALSWVPALSAPPASTFFVAQAPDGLRANFFFDPNARGRIVGTVKEKNTPANLPLARRVRLYRDRDGLLIAETWSNAAGDFVFEGIEESEAYTTLSYDHTHNYRAVAADNLTLANGGVELTT